MEFDSEEEEDTNQSTVLYTQSQIDRELGIPEGWTAGDPDIFVYIDDANSIEKVRIPGSITRISEQKQEVVIHAEKSEVLFNTVTARANEINMKVNTGKTQLLCISANQTSVATSYIRTGNEKIYSTDKLKILGFIFVTKPSVRPLV